MLLLLFFFKKYCICGLIADLHAVWHVYSQVRMYEAAVEDQTINLFLSSFRPHAHSQMVFYIEACESGSMMNHLPADIDGELNFSLSVTFRWNQEIMKLQSQCRINMKHQSLDSFWTWLHLVTIRPHPHLMRNLKVTTWKPISKNGQQRLMWFIGPFPPLSDSHVIFGPD